MYPEPWVHVAWSVNGVKPFSQAWVEGLVPALSTWFRRVDVACNTAGCPTHDALTGLSSQSHVKLLAP